jgi:hypothetical protein
MERCKECEVNDADRAKRDAEIVALFQVGNRPSNIAALYGLNAVRVRRILHAAGLEVDRQDGYPNGWSVWEMTERDRRRAIWERQREGAKQALRA